jgi:hypothetical protein
MNTTGVSNYAEAELNAKCRTITGKLAEEVQAILA